MKPRETFFPAQCRAARGLLDWTAETLSDRSGIDLERIRIFERTDGPLSATDHAALGQTFLDAGVVARPEGGAGLGVRFKWPSGGPNVIRGTDGVFRRFAPAADDLTHG